MFSFCDDNQRKGNLYCLCVDDTFVFINVCSLRDMRTACCKLRQAIKNGRQYVSVIKFTQQTHSHQNNSRMCCRINKQIILKFQQSLSQLRFLSSDPKFYRFQMIEIRNIFSLNKLIQSNE